MKKTTQKEALTRLTVTAVFLALSTVLSTQTVWKMPFGGSITPLSMVPVCLISVFYGVKYAVLPCLLYGAAQVFLGGVFGWGFSPSALIACILIDYIAAYGMLCFAGILRKKKYGMVLGVAVACILRLVCHIVSGVVIFDSLVKLSFLSEDLYNRVHQNMFLYSLVYNCVYMLPETVFTCIGVFLLSKSSAIKRLVKSI